MKKLITAILILLTLSITSSYAFEKDRESIQVINKVNKYGIVIASRAISEDNFKSSPKYFIRNTKSDASLFVKCTAHMSCTFEERFGRYDFDLTKKSRNLGNKDNNMFTLY